MPIFMKIVEMYQWKTRKSLKWVKINDKYQNLLYPKMGKRCKFWSKKGIKLAQISHPTTKNARNSGIFKNLQPDLPESPERRGIKWYRNTFYPKKGIVSNASKLSKESRVSKVSNVSKVSRVSNVSKMSKVSRVSKVSNKSNVRFDEKGVKRPISCIIIM